MKVKIGIEFEVSTDLDEDEYGELTENRAKSAASQAAYDYLSFVKISGFSSDAESVEVDVDGFGECKVQLGEDHD
jgi:hypothetical protein